MEANEPAPKLYKQYMTPGEYLEFERKATEKHEYVDGEVLPMERAYDIKVTLKDIYDGIDLLSKR